MNEEWDLDSTARVCLMALWPQNLLEGTKGEGSYLSEVAAHEPSLRTNRHT